MPHRSYRYLKANITRLKEERGIGYNKIAQDIGIDVWDIVKHDRGPNLATLNKIADYFEVEPHTLIEPPPD